ncbi:MAG: hypothetical protein K0U29_02810 [Gammaproteobacteria bacterium]|nr:hypothetical protein [Gammaproteobacteria bacterium]
MARADSPLGPTNPLDIPAPTAGFFLRRSVSQEQLTPPSEKSDRTIVTEEYTRLFANTEEAGKFFTIDVPTKNHEKLANIVRFIEHYFDCAMHDRRNLAALNKYIESDDWQPFWKEHLEAVKLPLYQLSAPLAIPDGTHITPFQQFAGTCYSYQKQFVEPDEHYFCELNQALFYYHKQEYDAALKYTIAALSKDPSSAKRAKLDIARAKLAAVQQHESEEDDEADFLLMRKTAGLKSAIESLYADAIEQQRRTVRVLRHFQHPFWAEMSVKVRVRDEISLRIATGDTNDSFIEGLVSHIDDATLEQFWTPAYYAKAYACHQAAEYYLSSIESLLFELKSLGHRYKSGKERSTEQQRIQTQIGQAKANAKKRYLEAIHYYEIAMQTYDLCPATILHAFGSQQALLDTSSLLYEDIEDDIVEHLQSYLRMGEQPSAYIKEHLPAYIRGSIFPAGFEQKKADIKAYMSRPVLPDEYDELNNLLIDYRGEEASKKFTKAALSSFIREIIVKGNTKALLQINKFVLEYRYRDLQNNMMLGEVISAIDIQMAQRGARSFLVLQGIHQDASEADVDCGLSDRRVHHIGTAQNHARLLAAKNPLSSAPAASASGPSPAQATL